ncbi:PREDICTED: uncharacterized protein LOC109185792 [Ipomoea nil]|uniref:uncharacterized protein LOC109185792 n=1 Tax=Ipomoea nil TaxID=35883 RepID=UPI0009018BDB|nr:PREDICTED: uncharacterized protein LOC109185792 [Ipomoea nil]
MILNTDGALKTITGLASAGGLIRDDHGRWVMGFATKVGFTDSFSAELWGLREGVRLYLREGIDKVWVEMYSAAVVATMNRLTALEKAGYESCRQIYTVKDLDFQCSGVKGRRGTVLRSALENNHRIMNFYHAKTLADADSLDAMTKENMKVSF